MANIYPESITSERERGNFVIQFLEAELKDYKFGLAVSAAPLAILLTKFESILNIDSLLLKLSVTIAVVGFFSAATGCVILIVNIHDWIQKQSLRMASPEYMQTFNLDEYTESQTLHATLLLFFGNLVGYISAMTFLIASVWS